MAIYLHGMLRFARQLVTRCWPMLLDTLLLYGAFYAASRVWATLHFNDPDYFRKTFYAFNLPLYTIVGMTAMFLYGAYDKPFERKRSYLGFLTGLLLILIIYAFLPFELRTSRMVIVLGSAIFMLIVLLTRKWFSPWRSLQNQHQQQLQRNAIIVGREAENSRIKELINRSSDHINIVGTVSPDHNAAVQSISTLGHVHQLRDIVRVHNVDEVIFSAQDVPFSVFTASMSTLGADIRYMLAASTTMNIVGSMNKDTEGESYGLRIDFNLTHAAARRSKRIFDLVSSLTAIVLWPLVLVTVRSPLRGLQHAFQVLSGKRTWVSYHPADPASQSLPKLKPGVLTPAYPQKTTTIDRRLEHIHFVYARDYHWTTDLSILLEQWNRIGQTLDTL